MHWETEELLYKAAKRGNIKLALKHLAKISPETTSLRWVLSETISLCISRTTDWWYKKYKTDVDYLLLVETLIEKGYVIHDNHLCNMTGENLDFYNMLVRKKKLEAL